MEVYKSKLETYGDMSNSKDHEYLHTNIYYPPNWQTHDNFYKFLEEKK